MEINDDNKDKPNNYGSFSEGLESNLSDFK